MKALGSTHYRSEKPYLEFEKVDTLQIWKNPNHVKSLIEK